MDKPIKAYALDESAADPMMDLILKNTLTTAQAWTGVALIEDNTSGASQPIDEVILAMADEVAELRLKYEVTGPSQDANVSDELDNEFFQRLNNITKHYKHQIATAIFAYAIESTSDICETVFASERPKQ